MRMLSLCVMVLFMAGCQSAPDQIDQAHVSSYVRLYTQADELLNSSFKELGIVAGESCRNTPQDPPASMTAARQRMLTKASSLNANAVLLHQCAIVSGQGCYQAAICEGTALLTTNK
ncbi:Rcs stress response system protein RcsF [Xenorhabdus szentirmaii]|uniref:Outer membrane lipoprotein RcsF n=2 Tax=Xenorhabdus szentirmaii TaxID=290112 RepID=W1IX25_9GAMM|nr:MULTISPECIES: Rcs stress response system protein RcsF [Xenorhabdus]MBD2782340.1 Rcs stress response system protein RcsF [Xenorhabdus sp. 38]MBD2793622.1 Rcs stress response system protein RcsF [Xenorhabdus sp. CUL]MBD2799655.1 Rcs stress response system protein RcsF [Xenorhabdus sp. M]MBD2803624.1 Rcs stress response system protein RcsF [Xenorhabdus sp. ZM]MBD2820399.1 Rcs stress response system protein RcsF [Xenorhabdus sp. 42]